jgi:hypothetical protein
MPFPNGQRVLCRVRYVFGKVLPALLHKIREKSRASSPQPDETNWSAAIASAGEGFVLNEINSFLSSL